MLLTIFIGVLTVSHIVLATGVSCHIVLKKDDVRSAVLWIGLVFLSPFIGSFIYLLLGVNRIQRAARRIRKTTPSAQPSDTSGEAKGSLNDVGRHLWQMHRLGQRVHSEEFTVNNSVEPLVNGDQAFPAMLEAIRGAKKYVALMTYIFDRDPAGLAFVEALSAAKRRGVQVRVLIDGVGIKYSKPPVDAELERHGISVARFMPTRKWRFWHLFNLRNHRKMLVVDGEIAYIGGMNIRHGNVLLDGPDHPIQDMHFEVRGPVIAQMNQIFEEDWLFATEEQIELPEAENRSSFRDAKVIARVVPDGPDMDMEKLQWLYLGALTCAQERILIITPYFLPDEVMLRTLQVAALRGVAVEIIIPKKSNLFGFDWAMEAAFPSLLEAGIKIYRSAPPFDHSKVMVVDDGWCSVGSCNWDSRSFRLNFECNLECASEDLALRLNEIFEEKKSRSSAVSLEDMRQHPRLVRLRNRVARLFSPYL